jgi:hypothetical protein
LCLVALGASPARAADWMPQIHQYWFDPSAPTVSDSLSIVFFGFYPYDCGEIADVQLTDPEHLQFTLRPGPACSDTLRTFTKSVLLGAYSEGLHTLTVRVRIEYPSAPAVVNEKSLEFLIAGPGGPPPPPPPPPPPTPFTFMPYISKVTFDPFYPNVLETTEIEFDGWSPFACFSIAESVVEDSEHFRMRFVYAGACSDTTQKWVQRFSLGFLPLGARDLNVALRFEDAVGAVTEANGVLRFSVFETSAGPPQPPPGPPGDSLAKVMSASRPNPFVTETQFGVSLDEPTRADVAVFDVTGRQVALLFDGVLPRGTSQFTWDGRQRSGDPMPGGIYFYRLTLPNRVITRRVVLLGNMERR